MCCVKIWYWGGPKTFCLKMVNINCLNNHTDLNICHKLRANNGECQSNSKLSKLFQCVCVIEWCYCLWCLLYCSNLGLRIWIGMYMNQVNSSSYSFRGTCICFLLFNPLISLGKMFPEHTTDLLWVICVRGKTNIITSIVVIVIIAAFSNSSGMSTRINSSA